MRDTLPSPVSFGVDYCHIVPPAGGDLYVTRYGWPYVSQLLPENWYDDKWYVTHGERLPGATGNVYRVSSKPVDGRSADLSELPVGRSLRRPRPKQHSQTSAASTESAPANYATRQ